MNMKKFAPIAALMVIGLLVITGCQDLLKPPTALKPADGSGILSVVINDAGSRTILPKAKLDAYTLLLEVDGGSGYAEYTGSYPKDPEGSTAFSVPAGKYKITVTGYNENFVDGTTGDLKVVATAVETDIEVPSGGTVSVAIELEPEDTGDIGYFSWDFEAEGIDTVAIEIYSVDDDATDLLSGEDEASEKVVEDYELEAGVYNVKFTVTLDSASGGGTYSWWETLYIYVGMTSVYGNDDLADISRDIFPTIPYVVPASGYGYFYVDLNDWKTVRASGVYTGPAIKGVTAADGITLYYTDNNQATNFGLTDAQKDLMLWSKGPINITVIGTASADNDFRYHIGNALAGGNWNATSGSGNNAKFSTIANASGITKEQTFSANKKTDGTEAENRASVAHLILQTQTAAATTVTIKSIKVEFPLGDDGFDLDLTQLAITGNNASNPAAITPTIVDDVLTATTTASAVGRIHVGLTDGQIDLLVGEGTVANPGAANVFITIWDAASTIDTGSNFRYHLGLISDNNNWNASSGSGNSLAFSAIASATGKTGVRQTLGNPERLTSGDAYFILNKQAGGADTIKISRIRVDYDKKPIAAPPSVCACTGCAVNGKTIAEAKDAWLWPTCTGAELSGCPVCSAIGAIPLDISAVTGLTDLTELGNSGGVTITSDLVEVIGGGYNGFFVEIPAGVDVEEAITITYALIMWPTDKPTAGGNAGNSVVTVILKKSNVDPGGGAGYPNINNVGDETYKQYVGLAPGASKTHTLTAGALDAGATHIGFQHNNGDAPGQKYQIKIISIANAD